MTTDYVKSTNFATKDALPSGNPAKIVKGTEIDTEFNNIAAAVTTKADSAATTAAIAAAVRGPAFEAYQTVAQAMAANVAAKVSLTTEGFDTATAFDSVTNYRFSPTTEGYYHIDGAFTIASLAQVTCYIYKNGVEYKRGTNTTGSTQSVVSALVYLNGAGDYVELWGFSSIAQNSFASRSNTYFNGHLARPV